MLALRFHEDQLVAPKVRHAVRDGLVETTSHRGRTGDGIRARALRDPGLNPDDRLRAVTRSGDSRVLVLWLDRFCDGNACGAIVDGCRRHEPITSEREGRRQPLVVI